MISKLYDLVVKRVFCHQTTKKNAFLLCSQFQRFNFGCLLLNLLIYYIPKTKTIFNFVYPLWTQSPNMISGSQIYSTLVFFLEFQSMLLSESHFWKSDSLAHCCRTQIFHDAKIFWRKPKMSLRSYKARSSQSCTFGKIHQCWKTEVCYDRASFSKADIIKSPFFFKKYYYY